MALVEELTDALLERCDHRAKLIAVLDVDRVQAAFELHQGLVVRTLGKLLVEQVAGSLLGVGGSACEAVTDFDERW
jgi:hypothetical protein